MSSQTNGVKGKIYIPPCKNEICESLLLKIKGTLKSDLDCVNKHNINGSFVSHFKRLFQECDFTIIHYCPFLWKRISSFEENLRTGESKVILVEFTDVIFTNEEECPGLKKLFSDFDSAQVLSTDDDGALQSLRDNILLCLLECTHTNDIIESNSVVTTKLALPRELEMEDEESENEEEDKVNFEKYPDFFGDKDLLQIFVSQKLVSAQTDFDTFNKTVQQINELGERLTKEEVMSTLKYIRIGVLPHLYRKKDVVKLASLSTCRHSSIHERALDYLEFLFLEKVDAVQDFSTLLQIESLLNEALRKLKFDCEKSNEKEFLPMLQRLANMYLLVIGSSIILSQENPEISSKCSSFLDTRAESLFVPSSKRVQQGMPFELGEQFDANLCLGIIDSVLAGPSKCKQVIKSAEDRLSDLDKPEDETGKSIKKNSTVHLVVSIKLLRRVFLLEQKALIHLHKYMKEEVKKCPFVYMILHSLTLFLDHKIQQFTHKEIDAICKDAIAVIDLTIPQEPAKQVDSFLQELLFHSNSSIRRSMIGVFNNHNRYGSCVINYLQNEIEHRLSPMLTNFTKQRSKEPGWKKAKCQFEHQESWIFFYNMNEKDHKMHKTKFKEYEDLHYTEMKRLTLLQHKNIIKMFAYHQDSIPQFYIIESCEQILQENLKNKRNNENFYTPSQLLQFLLDVVSGLIYCHNKDYVHCNLTAESLIVVNNDHVKVSSFGLCKKIEASSGKAIAINSKDIPRRWSAPESILEGEYSKASDIWMIGHLIYEIMTHGLLPYSNLKKNDDEIIELMKSKHLKLTIDPIVEKSALQQLLSVCVSYDEESRHYAANVKTSLKSMLIRVNQITQRKFIFPKVEDSKLSTNLKRGVPDKFHKRTIVKRSPNMIRAVVNVAENMERIQENKTVTFREKIHHKLSPAIESYFSSASLDNILPQRGVVQYSNEMPYIECKITDESCYCLLDVALTKKVKDVSEIFFFLRQVAATLVEMSRLSFVIGYLCASNVYVELTDAPKTHIISLAYLKSLDIEEEHSDELRLSFSNTIRLRTAPEVLLNGRFSVKSDVYCFGNFMWELLTAFDNGNTSQLFKPQIKFFRGLKGEVYDAIQSGEWESYHCRPQCCPESLYELIKLCISVNEVDRPAINQVMVKLDEYCKTKLENSNDNNVQKEHPSESLDLSRLSLREVNPSIYSRSSSSHSSNSYLSVINPSSSSSSSTS